METPFEKNIWERKTFKHLNKGCFLVFSSSFVNLLLIIAVSVYDGQMEREEESHFLGFGMM